MQVLHHVIHIYFKALPEMTSRLFGDSAFENGALT